MRLISMEQQMSGDVQDTNKGLLDRSLKLIYRAKQTGLGAWAPGEGCGKSCTERELAVQMKCCSVPGNGGGLSPLTGPGVRVQISSFCEMMVLRKEGARGEPVPTGYY